MEQRLVAYYEKHPRMNYGGGLWTRMVDSLNEEDRLKLLPFTYSCGTFVNTTGERIEKKFQRLYPELSKKIADDNLALSRWLQDEFLRRLLQEEMRQCPVDGILCARQLHDFIQTKPRNRLVQTVYALVSHCGT